MRPTHEKFAEVRIKSCGRQEVFYVNLDEWYGSAAALAVYREGLNSSTEFLTWEARENIVRQHGCVVCLPKPTGEDIVTEPSDNTQLSVTDPQYANTLINFEHEEKVKAKDHPAFVEMVQATNKEVKRDQITGLCPPSDACCGNECKNCQNATLSVSDGAIYQAVSDAAMEQAHETLDKIPHGPQGNFGAQFVPFSNFESNVVQWALDRNIINGGSLDGQMNKLQEEFDELALALSENNIHEVRDAIGDMNVVLCIIAAMKGLRLSECQRQAWDGGEYLNPKSGEIEKGIWKRTGKMVNGTFVKDAK